ncbi:MAG: tetratricopeptide repeat protein [Treponema sp.]|jgi:tetratricopeptide (TPR) repeat protein|nr:tetratricopeptide repeat protein [Treponema sp.]
MPVPEKVINAENIANYQVCLYEYLQLIHVPITVVPVERERIEKSGADYNDSRLREDIIFSVNEFFVKGQELLEAGEYDKAIESCTTAIKLNPQHLFAYFTRGMTHFMKGEYEQSNEDFGEAVHLNPIFIMELDEGSRAYMFAFSDDCMDLLKAFLGECYHHRGLACQQLTWMAEALEDYSDAIEIFPNSAILYYYRASVLISYEEPDEAIADCEKALELSPGLTKVHSMLGSAYNIKEEYEKAIEHYNKALAANPENVSSLLNRSFAYFKLKNYSASVSDAARAVALDPAYPEARFYSGIALMEMGEYKKALADFDEAIRLDEKYEIAILKRKETLEKLSNNSGNG